MGWGEDKILSFKHNKTKMFNMELRLSHTLLSQITLQYHNFNKIQEFFNNILKKSFIPLILTVYRIIFVLYVHCVIVLNFY